MVHLLMTDPSDNLGIIYRDKWLNREKLIANALKASEFSSKKKMVILVIYIGL